MENRQRLSVSLKGITKDKPQLQSSDGDCEELINLRYIDGAWRGVGAKSQLEYSIVTANIYSHIIHPDMLDENMFIGYCPDNKRVNLLTAIGTTQSESVVLITLNDTETFISFTWLNNTLVIYTSERVIAMQYMNGTGFINLPDLNDKTLPSPRLAVGDENEGVDPYKVIESGDYGDSGAAYTQDIHDQVLADFLPQFYESQELGNMIGYMSFVFAFKLFDGNYILHQGAFPLNLDIAAPTLSSTGVVPNVQFRLTAQVTRPAVYYFFPQDIRDAIKLWYDAGLIQNFSVFMSNPINPYDIYETDVSKWISNSCPRDFTEVDKIPETTNYYLIGNISIDDIMDSALDEPGKYTVILDKGQLQSIETLEVLPVDNFTHHDLIPQETYKFNSRMHLGNITTIPGKIPWPFLDWFDSASADPAIGGFRPRCDAIISLGYMAGSIEEGKGIFENADYNLHIAVTLDIDGRKVMSIRDIDTDSLRLWGNGVYIHSLASYPDLRAIKMEVLVSYSGDTDSPRLIQSFDLVKHPYHNMAYYKSDSELWYRPTYITFPVNNADYLALTAWGNTYDETFTEQNRIQVSEVNNVFYYPAKQSYRIGNPDHTIRAMIVAQEPLTEMQFGQFPLYCFTAGGVFALEYAGGGEVLYSRITQFLTDVIREGVTPVALAGGAIVYQELSAVKILIGREAKDISRAVISNSKNPIYNDAHLIAITSDPVISNLRSAMDDPDSSLQMVDFILNSRIGYDHTRKEILFSKLSSDPFLAAGEFTLVYQLTSGSWYKRTEIFRDYLHDTGGHLGMVNEVVDGGEALSVKYGLLYNWYAATDERNITGSGDWIVPTSKDLETLLDYIDVYDTNYDAYLLAGGLIKLEGTTKWDLPNTGATNSLGFNFSGAGVRTEEGLFEDLRIEGIAMTTTPSDSGYYALGCIFDSETASIQDIELIASSIRLVRNASESEQLLDDGLISTTYTGNDGKIYRCTKIGTQVWLADNLAETKYRNGDSIPEVTDNSAWAALTTGALCAYNNDWDNAYISTPGTAYQTSLYKLSTEVETTDGESSFMQKPWVFMQTRPFSLGQPSYKRIEDTIARYQGINRIEREIDYYTYQNNYGALYNWWALMEETTIPALELTFDDIANVPVADASSVSDWNTFFDLPTNGGEFSSVVVVGNVVTLIGGSGITIKDNLFASNINILKIIDNSNCVVELGFQALWRCFNLNECSFPSVIIVGNYCFEYDYLLEVINLPSATTIGEAAFYVCYGILNYNLSSCINLGTTTGNNSVWSDIDSKTITLTIPAALMTCNGGSPDGDIQYLQVNNTVTIVTV